VYFVSTENVKSLKYLHHVQGCAVNVQLMYNFMAATFIFVQSLLCIWYDWNVEGKKCILLPFVGLYLYCTHFVVYSEFNSKNSILATNMTYIYNFLCPSSSDSLI